MNESTCNFVPDLPQSNHGAGHPHWYAAYVITRHEKVVAAQLLQKSVESFLPLYRTVHYWNKRKAEVELPIFPSYVFVRFAAQERLRVLEVPGLVHIVSFNGVQASVSDEEIEALRAALRSRQHQPYPYLSAGTRIRIKTGPLRGLEGVISRQKNATQIIVSMDFIQRSVSVELEPSDLECLPELVHAGGSKM